MYVYAVFFFSILLYLRLRSKLTLSVGYRLGIEKDLIKHDMMTKLKLPLGEHGIVL